MGLFNELLDVLEAERRTVPNIAYTIKTFDTIEERLDFLALIVFEVHNSKQVGLGSVEGGALIGDFV